MQWRFAATSDAAVFMLHFSTGQDARDGLKPQNIANCRRRELDGAADISVASLSTLKSWRKLKQRLQLLPLGNFHGAC